MLLLSAPRDCHLPVPEEVDEDVNADRAGLLEDVPRVRLVPDAVALGVAGPEDVHFGSISTAPVVVVPQEVEEDGVRFFFPREEEAWLHHLSDPVLEVVHGGHHEADRGMEEVLRTHVQHYALEEGVEQFLQPVYVGAFQGTIQIVRKSCGHVSRS